MKTISLFLIFLACAKTIAQQSSPEAVVKSFFEAFHRQDTTTLRAMMAEDFQLQSVGLDSTTTVRL
ncbi:MAG: hypothetical protein WBG71_01485 [Leeuwenhoekiella sp.]